MSSKADRNIDATLAMVAGMTKILVQYYEQQHRSKTVVGILNAIQCRAEKAMDLWTGQLDKKSVKRISGRIELFRTEHCKEYDVSYYANLALALVDDISVYYHGKKKQALDSLIFSLLKLNRHYDRNLDKPDIYQQAAHGADCWVRLGI